MKSKKQHISFSEFRLWNACQHKWYLQRFLEIPEVSSGDSLVFGSAIHATLEKIAAKAITRAQWISTFSKAWQDELSKRELDVALLPKHKQQARIIFQQLNFDKEFRDYEIVCIEQQLYESLFEEEEEEFFFKGFIDLVLRHKKTKRYVIIDWKTAMQPWKLEDKQTDYFFWGQLALYRYFFAKAQDIDPELIDVKFITLARMNSPIVTHYEVKLTDEYIFKVIASVRQAAREIKAVSDKSAFSKARTTGNLSDLPCKWCGFKSTPYCNDKKHQKVKAE